MKTLIHSLRYMVANFVDSFLESMKYTTDFEISNNSFSFYGNDINDII